MWRGFPAAGEHAPSAPIADRSVPPGARPALPVRLVYPDGTVVGAADPTLPTMVIHRSRARWRRGSAATA